MNFIIYSNENDFSIYKQLVTNHRCVVSAFLNDNAKDRDQLFGIPVLTPENVLSNNFGLVYDYIIIPAKQHELETEKLLSLSCPKDKIIYYESTGYKLLPNIQLISDEEFKLVSSIPWWFHKLEIAHQVYTPGVCDYKPWLLDDPRLQCLDGKQILDIGAWDGVYTLEMTKRGGSVTAFDIQNPERCGFNVMTKLYNINCNHICDNVYNLSSKKYGKFDIVTFFGVYYHLKNPILAFNVDDYWKDKYGILNILKNESVAIYCKGLYQGIDSNWWVPSLKCLHDMIESCGFKVEYSKECENSGSRGFLFCKKQGAIPQEHAIL